MALRIVRGRRVFAPPKGGKTRYVPLPDSVALQLSAHLAAFPAVDVTLPWLALAGKPVTHRLIFSSPNGNAIHCTYFNQGQWRLALVRAGIVTAPPKGEMPESHREHGMHSLRHFYASVLLDGGESIKALSEYLGHHDPGFTLRTYTHLMPSSEDRTRKAVDRVFGAQAQESCALCGRIARPAAGQAAGERLPALQQGWRLTPGPMVLAGRPTVWAAADGSWSPLEGVGYPHTALPRMAPRPGVFQWSTTITFFAFTYQTRWV
ncbi:tyrosine-type recombinase/integrase [Nonomuraea sp. NPDC005983]|uniref:tyrosine-type recombinase/integrase n=1 Tax=Nonomuraea sp. NPDC005983 TaxID=3155595 RepID=UPI0033B3E617